MVEWSYVDNMFREENKRFEETEKQAEAISHILVETQTLLSMILSIFLPWFKTPPL